MSLEDIFIPRVNEYFPELRSMTPMLNLSKNLSFILFMVVGLYEIIGFDCKSITYRKTWSSFSRLQVSTFIKIFIFLSLS